MKAKKDVNGPIKELWIMLNEFIFAMHLMFPILTPFVIGFMILVSILLIGAYYLPAKYVDILAWISFILISFFAVRRAFRNVAFLKDLEEGRVAIPKEEIPKVIKKAEESLKRRRW